MTDARAARLAAWLLAVSFAATGCFGFDFFGANNVEPSVGQSVSAEAEGKELPALIEMFTREASGPFLGYGVFRATMLDYAILRARVAQRAQKEWWDAARTRAELRRIPPDSLAFEAYIAGPSRPDGWGRHWKFVLIDSHRRKRAPGEVVGAETPPGWAMEKETRVFYNYLTLRFPSYQIYEGTRFVKLVGVSPKRERYELVWNFIR